MVDVDDSNLPADLQAKSVGLVWGWRPKALSLHSSNEPGELLQWPCHDDSTIDIVISISIIWPHRSTTYLDAAYCYRWVAWSVGQSVRLVSLQKWLNWLRCHLAEDSGGPRELCIRGPDPHVKEQFWGGGKERPIVKYRDILRSAMQKMAEPIDV